MNPVVRLSVSLLAAYKRWLSPLLPRACRFSPTCSEYGQIALRSHGLIVGGCLTAGRLLRCQPLGRGGIDLPPAAALALPDASQARGPAPFPTSPERLRDRTHSVSSLPRSPLDG